MSRRDRWQAYSVQEVLPSRFVAVSPEDTIKRAMSIMTYERVRHLPVIAGDKLVGIVSLGDIVKYRLEELELETNVLRDIYIAARCHRCLCHST